MNKPNWIITRDVLAERFKDEPTKRLVTAEVDKDAYPVRFKLYDDDGELYYEGRARTDDDVEEAHDWGMGFAGTTRSAISNGISFSPFIG